MKNKIKDKEEEKKEPIKIKMSTLILLFLIIAILIITIVFLIVNNNNSFKNNTNIGIIISKIFKKQPEWIIEIDGQKVFNIDYNEFNEKIKKRLEEATALTIEESTGSKKYGGEVVYPEGWIIAESKEQKTYAYGQLQYVKTLASQLVKIEEYKGKVKSITFLESTDSIPNIITAQVLYEIFQSYGIIHENKEEIFKEYVNFKGLKQEKAIILVSKFYDRYGSASIVADAYRENGHFGYIPFEYNKSEFGNYINISIKE